MESLCISFIVAMLPYLVSLPSCLLWGNETDRKNWGQTYLLCSLELFSHTNVPPLIDVTYCICTSGPQAEGCRIDEPRIQISMRVIVKEPLITSYSASITRLWATALGDTSTYELLRPKQDSVSCWEWMVELHFLWLVLQLSRWCHSLEHIWTPFTPLQMCSQPLKCYGDPFHFIYFFFCSIVKWCYCNLIFNLLHNSSTTVCEDDFWNNLKCCQHWSFYFTLFFTALLKHKLLILFFQIHSVYTVVVVYIHTHLKFVFIWEIYIL